MNKMATRYQATRQLLWNVHVEDIMTSPVRRVSEDANLGEVQELFTREGMSHVCVVDQNARLIGLISSKYLYKAQSPQRVMTGVVADREEQIMLDGDSYYGRDSLNDIYVSEVMQTMPPTLYAQDSVELAIRRMIHLKVDFMPVINQDEKVKGVLKERNIINLISSCL